MGQALCLGRVAWIIPLERQAYTRKDSWWLWVASPNFPLQSVGALHLPALEAWKYCKFDYLGTNMPVPLFISSTVHLSGVGEGIKCPHSSHIHADDLKRGFYGVLELSINGEASKNWEKNWGCKFHFVDRFEKWILLRSKVGPFRCENVSLQMFFFLFTNCSTNI